jgi:hypothetical protein
MNSSHTPAIALFATLLCWAGCSPESLRSEMVPKAPAIVPPAGAPAHVGRFLYVAGDKLSEYELGSPEPLHTDVNYYAGGAAIALDRHGHLCESNGNVSAAQLFEYDARTLKLLRGLNGVGAYFALVADPRGYLYATTGESDIYVYAWLPSSRERHPRRFFPRWSLIAQEISMRATPPKSAFTRQQRQGT